MTNNDKWYDVYTIICIKNYETLNVGSSYKVLFGKEKKS